MLQNELGAVVPTFKTENEDLIAINDTIPIINSVAAPLSLLNSNPSILEFNKELVVEIKGYQFHPESKVFLFEGSTNYYDLYNMNTLKEYKTNVVDNITTDYILNNIDKAIDIKTSGFKTTETGKVTVINNVDGITYFGYKNPQILVVKINLIESNVITEGYYNGKVYSVVVQNPNGEIGVLNNCLTITQTGATQMKFDLQSISAVDSLYGEADLYNNNIFTDPDNLPLQSRGSLRRLCELHRFEF